MKKEFRKFLVGIDAFEEIGKHLLRPETYLDKFTGGRAGLHSTYILRLAKWRSHIKKQ